MNEAKQPEKMRRRPVLINDSLWAAIKAAALKHGLTACAYIRQAAAAMLKREPRK